MSYVDIAIPGAFGLLLVIWPRLAFLGSRVDPDESKALLVRKAGAVLLLVASGLLAIKVLD